MLKNSNSSQAKTAYRNLRLRSQVVDKELGEGMSNPSLYGNLLIDTQSDNLKEVRQRFTEKLRVLPSMTRFAKELEVWALQGMAALRFER